MAKLDNPKHEAFAGHLARGLSQSRAYVQAGYNKNIAGASRLANSPAVIARVDELKKEVAQKIQVAMHEPSEENFQSLADMGLDMSWVARAFKKIYEDSLASGQFAPANTAVSNIQKLIELEGKAKGDGDESGTPKIEIDRVTAMLGKVADIVKAAKDSPEIIDITPPEIPEDKDDNPE